MCMRVCMEEVGTATIKILIWDHKNSRKKERKKSPWKLGETRQKNQLKNTATTTITQDDEEYKVKRGKKTEGGWGGEEIEPLKN